MFWKSWSHGKYIAHVFVIWEDEVLTLSNDDCGLLQQSLKVKCSRGSLVWVPDDSNATPLELPVSQNQLGMVEKLVLTSQKLTWLP